MSHAPLLAEDSLTLARSGPAVPLPQVESLAALGLRLSRQFAQCRREGGQLAMLWIEFEVVERAGDGLGSEERHGLVHAASQRMRNRVRGADEVVRVGEQGFAVLLLAAGAQEAVLVERRLLQALKGAYGVDGRLMQMAVRVGRAVFPDHGRHGADLAEVARRDLRERAPD